MVDMSVEFLGGELEGKSLSPISEDELENLGYRSAIKTKPRGEELINCVAVPVTWTPSEAHNAIKAKLGVASKHQSGKRSL